MVARDSVRKSGRTTGDEVVREASKEADELPVAELPDERLRKFKTTGFNRMPLEWGEDDKIMMVRIHQAVDKKIDEFFGDLILMQYELLSLVRDEVPDGDGGMEWERSSTGALVEHWDRLNSKERPNWIFKIQSNIVDWEKRSTEAWAEAMFAKAKWEDAFSIGFEVIENHRATVQDREARAKLLSRDERYFALFVTYYSRMAEGYVRNMRDLLAQLSRVHQAAAGR